MIHQQIKKYDEPVYQTQQYHYGNNHQTEEEKKAWADLCKSELEEARKHFDVGDRVKTNNTYTAGEVIITDFLTNPAQIHPYKDKPCFIMATNPRYQSYTPSRYSLQEFDLTSVQKAKNVTE